MPDYCVHPCPSFSGACKAIPAVAIEGPRLLLTPFDESITEEESRTLYQYSCVDQDLYRWMRFDPRSGYDVYRNQHLIGRWTRSADRLPFIARDKHTNEIVGINSFMSINGNDKTIEIGHIWTAGPFQGQKVALESTQLLMRYAMDLGFVRIEWRTHHKNVPSQRTAAAAGFTFEGILRKQRFLKGETQNTFSYSVIDDEFDAVRKTIDAVFVTLRPIERRPVPGLTGE
ncbi:acyl-CoA N-acyltransferase [Polychytrium aggregatum]|uniref:acyl-CoA N-acyltransferase n=1 Tax=Polychytrium aggregatum TaxID=110093 RepID=UPI0022FDC779|nr:acyl-CoA N-acyltransferase [Polychytrium aggregatum]KAI9204981.1 acyl-CoA N-acyltransferase [Polychytrium aggregatum]